jgi:hypothetical protein
LVIIFEIDSEILFWRIRGLKRGFYFERLVEEDDSCWGLKELFIYVSFLRETRNLPAAYLSWALLFRMLIVLETLFKIAWGK